MPAWVWAGYAVGLALVALAVTLDDAPSSLLLTAGVFLIVGTTTALMARVLGGGRRD